MYHTTGRLSGTLFSSYPKHAVKIQSFWKICKQKCEKLAILLQKSCVFCRNSPKLSLKTISGIPRWIKGKYSIFRCKKWYQIIDRFFGRSSLADNPFSRRANRQQMYQLAQHRGHENTGQERHSYSWEMCFSHAYCFESINVWCWCHLTLVSY